MGIPGDKVGVGSDTHHDEEGEVDWTVDEYGVQERVIGYLAVVLADLQEDEKKHQEGEHNDNKILEHKLDLP